MQYYRHFYHPHGNHKIITVAMVTEFPITMLL